MNTQQPVAKSLRHTLFIIGNELRVLGISEWILWRLFLLYNWPFEFLWSFRVFSAETNDFIRDSMGHTFWWRCLSEETKELHYARMFRRLEINSDA